MDLYGDIMYIYFTESIVRQVMLVEESICCLEKALGVSVTIIDNRVVTLGQMRRRIFPGNRMSHLKNPVCEYGFDDYRCIGHCRYQMNELCQDRTEPYITNCWKGISEILIPLVDSGVHYGLFYVGSWRGPGEAPPGLPEEFYRLREALPTVDATMLPLLQIFADGVVAHLRKLHLLEFTTNPKVARIIGFIREHAAEKIGLPDLAEALDLSQSRTSVLTSRLFGKSFSELLLIERVNKAGQLLAGTRLNLAEIAARCGFCDEFHLSKAFKRLTGMPPREWRILHRKTGFRDRVPKQ